MGQTSSRYPEVKKKKKSFILSPNCVSAFLLLFDVKSISNLPLKMEVALSLTHCRWPTVSSRILFIVLFPALCILAVCKAFCSSCSASLKADPWLVDFLQFILPWSVVSIFMVVFSIPLLYQLSLGLSCHLVATFNPQNSPSRWVLLFPFYKQRDLGKCFSTDSPPKSHPITAPPKQHNNNKNPKCSWSLWLHWLNH